MNFEIRKETKADFEIVQKVIERAFENESYSDHKEHFLVSKLRKSDAFIPELSLVAEHNNMIIGHILLTKLTIETIDKKNIQSLALAPVSVLPEYQKKGVGSALILESHKIAKNLGFKSIILLGHKDYYPRFGYEPTVKYGLKSPFDVPDEFFMIKFFESTEPNLSEAKVVYPKEFFE